MWFSLDLAFLKIGFYYVLVYDVFGLWINMKFLCVKHLVNCKY